MGKKGDLLRAAKAQKSSYTFTRAQLEEHDRQVSRMAIERKQADLIAQAKDVLEKDFEEREKVLTGSVEDVTARVFGMLISISCKVLVAEFGWKPIWKHSTSRNRLSRFVVAVKEEVEMLINDERLDIRNYVKEVYDLTGVMMEPEEENNDSDNQG